MSDASPAELLAAGGPAPQPQIEGFTAPVPVVAEESTTHKAKRLATDAAHSVSTAVTAGLESASASISSAAASAKTWSDRELVRTGHSNAENADPLKTELPVEPTLRDKAHNALNSAQFAIERAAESTLAGAKIASHKIAEGIHTIGEKLEPTAQAISSRSSSLADKALAQGSLALEKGKALVSGSSSSDKQVSDASHSAEKKDGSLPVERNADEFPHAQASTSFEADSRIASAAVPLLQPGESGLGTDKKIVDAPLAKVDATPQVDAITGEAKPLVV